MERIEPITPEEYTRRTGKPYTYLSKFHMPIIEPVKWYDRNIAFGVTARELMECASLVIFMCGSIKFMQVIL